MRLSSIGCGSGPRLASNDSHLTWLLALFHKRHFTVIGNKLPCRATPHPVPTVTRSLPEALHFPHAPPIIKLKILDLSTREANDDADYDCPSQDAKGRKVNAE